MDKLLKLLEQNARFTNDELAVMIGTTAKEIEKRIAEYEEKGVIKGYQTIIDKDMLDIENVSALIELRVTPKRDSGFDEIANQIMEFEEVENLYLMSGGYDLAVMIKAKDFKQVALFVSQRLSQLDTVVSTATHFILTRYKDKGVLFVKPPEDERGSIGL